MFKPCLFIYFPDDAGGEEELLQLYAGYLKYFNGDILLIYLRKKSKREHVLITG